jgi:hypothetical protein
MPALQSNGNGTGGISLQKPEDVADWILREWYISTARALTDSGETQRVLSFLQPNFEHHGRVIALMLRNKLAARRTDAIGIANYVIAFGSLVGILTRNLIGSRDEVRGTFSDCPLQGMHQTVCILGSEFMLNGLVQEINPDYDWAIRRQWTPQGTLCHWTIRKRGEGSQASPLSRDIELEDLDMTKEELTYLSAAGNGQTILMVTKGMVESLGSERALSYLLPQARSVGKRAASAMAIDGRGSDSECGVLISALATMTGRMQQAISISRTDAAVEGRVTECAFSQGMPEVCRQFEAICDGVCATLRPGLEFTYDRMMPSGDPDCHWTVGRRAKTGQGMIEDGHEEVLHILKVRLAKGEISEEEYDHLRDKLSQA